MTAHDDIVRFPLPMPFPGGPVNVHLARRDPPVLIDAGPNTSEAWDRLQDRLREQGLRVADIGAVFITHGHLDHAGLLGHIVDESGAQAYAHPTVLDQYRDYAESFAETSAFIQAVMRRAGVTETVAEEAIAIRNSHEPFGASVGAIHPLYDCETVEGLVAVHAPGHSASDILYYDPGRRAAFTGDHLLRNITPNPGLRRPRADLSRPRSLMEYENSLRRTRALDIELCYPGHGAPFPKHRDVIDRLFQRHDQRTRAIRDFLKKGPATPYALVGMLFPRIKPLHVYPALSAVIGHLDVLEARGEARHIEQNGVLVYALV